LGCAEVLEEKAAAAVVTSALQTSRNGGVGRNLTEMEQPYERNGCIDDPAEAAADAAARPSVGLFPATCITKTADGAHLHADFDGCTGVFGRVTMVGGMDAVFEPAGECRMHASITDSGDFTANDRPLDYEADADILYRDGYRDVDWAAHWEGTTRRGRHVEQSSSLNVLVDTDTNCLDLVGTTRGRVDEWEFSTVIDDLSICPDACPTSGVVEATLEGRRKDRTLSVEFDGSNTAYVTGWTGREFELEMVCGGEEG
jgi:hypothetical protein